jgi:hypothetical protein
MNRYEELKGKLAEIKALSMEFPDELQPIVCKGLIDALSSPILPNSSAARGAAALHGSSESNAEPRHVATAVSGGVVQTPSGRLDWPGVATFDPISRRLSITVRDWKVTSKKQQGIRCAYLIIRAWEKFTGEESLSSRDVMTPILQEHRLYDGNLRHALAQDKGIHRDKDTLWLDVPGKSEADRIIAEIIGADG